MSMSSSVDRKSTRLNSSHLGISYAVFCLKKKKHMNSSHLGISYAVFCLKKKNTQKFVSILIYNDTALMYLDIVDSRIHTSCTQICRRPRQSITFVVTHTTLCVIFYFYTF